ncbi:hypothetical protein FHL15_004094 [Xylaria flabelliformis]|uniref:Uncharacterized protein n=1 Tax=Xylaria flabelliformis TaxID=2512241 RepID=A0A553I477_9PEZI|nr:hypothetical protein FHL15_004094 [Xylaria flabelliformis]
MAPKKRGNNRRASDQGPGNRARRKPSSSSNQEGLSPLRPTGNFIGQNPSPMFEIPVANNAFGMQEMVHPAPGLQTAPYTNNTAYGYAPVPQWPPPGGISESEYIRLFRSYIPPPPTPGRVGQVYGDARDYLPHGQQEILAGRRSLRDSQSIQSGRCPVNPSQHTLNFNGGHLGSRLQDERSIGHRLGPNPFSSGTFNGIVQPQTIPNTSTTRSGPKAGLFRPTARLNHLINEIPDTPTPRGRASHDRAGKYQLSKIQKARKFSDRDSTPPTPSFKRGRLIEDITDQEEGENPSQASVVYNRNSSNDAVSHSSPRDLISGAGSHSFKPDVANSTTRNSASFLSGSFMGSNDNRDTVEAPVMAPPRRGIIMADNYNIFNPSLMGRVAAECENGPYMNTPSAIATYHQLAMADDLFYDGIWKGMFKVNGSYIIQYNNPGPRRPEVPESQRNDRRLLMARIQKDGKMCWHSVMNGNVLIPAANEMENGSAEHQNTLDLTNYFYARVPCHPSIDRYAELVAPLHIDRSRESIDENEAIVGMAPGSNTATAALRLATPAEASSAEAAAALRYIPPVRNDNPPPAATETPAAPVDSFSVGAPSNVPAALLPPGGTSMTSSVIGSSFGDLGLFPDLGTVPNASIAPPPLVNSGWSDPSGNSLFPDLGINRNAPATSGASFPFASTRMAQDAIGLDMTTLGAYRGQPLIPNNPSMSVEMYPFEEPYTGFRTANSSHITYPSIYQNLGATPTSADMVPNVLAHSDAFNDALIATATVPTSAAQVSVANAGTISANPFPEYVMPNSDLGLDANAMMFAASFDPDGDGGNLAASLRTDNAGSDLPMQAWLKSGRRSSGSISLGSDEDLFSSFIDPSNLGDATSATTGDNLVGNGTVGTNNRYGVGNTLAGNEESAGNDQLINGVLFSNGAIADESSDGCTDTQSSEFLSEDLVETKNEEIDEDEELEEIDGELRVRGFDFTSAQVTTMC